LFLNQYASFSIVFLFAISKEIYDEYKYSGFDWRDLVTTLIPAFLLTLKNLIL
jgi:hypothetical protein